jgi:hypothetical protein
VIERRLISRFLGSLLRLWTGVVFVQLWSGNLRLRRLLALNPGERNHPRLTGRAVDSSGNACLA